MVKGAPAKAKDFAQVAGFAYIPVPLPQGMEPGLSEEAFFEPSNNTYPFGCHISMVEVEVEVLPPSITLSEGHSTTASAVVREAGGVVISGASVTWTVDDSAVATVSSDGRRVAMVLSKNGSPDVYVSDIDGNNPRQLTKTKEDESSPTWSPDGRSICYVSREGGRAALYLIGTDGSGKRRLTTTGAINCTEPDWSPDGKTIVFTANMSGFQICTVPATGGAATTLVSGEDPSWAPNSRTVVFTRRVSGGRIVSLLDVPTKRVKDVHHVSGSCSQPSWAK